MKKRIIFMTIAILIGIFAGVVFFRACLSKNKVPRTFPVHPPKKVEQKLQEAARKKWGREFSWMHLDENGEMNYGSRYYGTYGDCIAVFESTMLCWVETKTIADSAFTHSSSFVIWIYHAGELHTIEAAWEQGLLTKKQVALMAEYHENAVAYLREYAQAQMPK